MIWFRKNSLILSIFFAIILGALAPEWGAKGGKLHSEIIIQIGIFFIFFSQGLSLHRAALLDGIRFWQLHVFTQTWIYLGIPLIALLLLTLSGELLPPGLKLGVFFLSVLPTTISSAIAFVSEGEGNVPGAIFNTALSNLAAVFVLPAWILFYQKSLSGVELEMWPIFLNLLRLLFIPFFIGFFSKTLFQKLGLDVNRIAKPTNQAIIAFIVYSTFATSFQQKLWEQAGSEIAAIGLGCGFVLLCTSSVLVWLSCRFFFKMPKSRITAFFTASQKSLAVGIPYSVTFFSTLSDPTDPTLKHSIIILPLLCFHPMQLFLAGVMLRFREKCFGNQHSED